MAKRVDLKRVIVDVRGNEVDGNKRMADKERMRWEERMRVRDWRGEENGGEMERVESKDESKDESNEKMNELCERDEPPSSHPPWKKQSQLSHGHFLLYFSLFFSTFFSHSILSSTIRTITTSTPIHLLLLILRS